jgi:hypothetical protein
LDSRNPGNQAIPERRSSNDQKSDVNNVNNKEDPQAAVWDQSKDEKNNDKEEGNDLSPPALSDANIRKEPAREPSAELSSSFSPCEHH